MVLYRDAFDAKVKNWYFSSCKCHELRWIFQIAWGHHLLVVETNTPQSCEYNSLI